MKTETLTFPRHATFILRAGCIVMLLVATVRLTAIAGPPIVIWTIIRSHGTSVAQLPKAFNLYVNQIAQAADMTTTGVWLRLASQVLAELLLVFLAIVLLLRKPWSRIVFLLVCLIFSIQHAHGAMAAFKLGPRHGIRQVGWVLLYIGLGFVFTRPSIATLFIARTGDSADVAEGRAL
jgi:hypothetical protein